MKNNKLENDLIVEVAKSSYDGKIFSHVFKDSERGRKPSIVIDWECSKLRADSIKSRAKAIAQTVGAQYKEDLTWHCLSLKKMPCRCPLCINN